ncbi:MAG: 3-oxoacyl-[acyl-carrier-protein] synthase III C-terminal domain-containing protein [Paracoccus sp. (in: a-proteobacteria)]|nr:3-oxoacyl-[acyl-carrier-protein] synthase III C-terminal domain-containing protein [Paracoccus sp. (in: a-proteobacteria)]
MQITDIQREAGRAQAAPVALAIRGTGAYLPRQRRDSRQIDARLGWPLGETARRFGIEGRYVADAGETSSMMGAVAAERALQAAGVGARDLDLILGACGVMEQPIPSTAVLIQSRLGLEGTGIPAYDINATCLSFVAALDHAGLMIAAGRARHVLIVSADIASVGLDWSRPEGAAIFGDGAAAVVLGRADEGEAAPALLATRIETYSEGREACVLAAGGTRINPARGIAPSDALFRMDGQAAFRTASRHLPRFVARLLAASGLRRDDLDLVIPHQASAQALDHAAALLGFDDSRLINIFARCGNQIAASIPMALHEAVSTGRLKRGQNALLIGTSAGVSLGGAVLRY